MKKLTVFIDGSSKLIDLQESLVVTHNPYILLKDTVFWDYNIIDHINNELIYSSVKKTIETEYWTFNLLGKESESYRNVKLDKSEYDGTCSLTSDNKIELKTLESSLGILIIRL